MFITLKQLANISSDVSTFGIKRKSTKQQLVVRFHFSRNIRSMREAINRFRSDTLQNLSWINQPRFTRSSCHCKTDFFFSSKFQLTLFCLISNYFFISNTINTIKCFLESHPYFFQRPTTEDFDYIWSEWLFCSD